MLRLSAEVLQQKVWKLTFALCARVRCSGFAGFGWIGDVRSKGF